jgi:hypothetical protein
MLDRPKTVCSINNGILYSYLNSGYIWLSIICTAEIHVIATGYGLDGRGSIPGRGKIFLWEPT